MDEEWIQIIDEAVKSRVRHEPFERSLGRVIRNRGGSFELYIQIIGEVRDYARRRRIDLFEAARRMTGKKED